MSIFLFSPQSFFLLPDFPPAGGDRQLWSRLHLQTTDLGIVCEFQRCSLWQNQFINLFANLGTI